MKSGELLTVIVLFAVITTAGVFAYKTIRRNAFSQHAEQFVFNLALIAPLNLSLIAGGALAIGLVSVLTMTLVALWRRQSVNNEHFVSWGFTVASAMVVLLSMAPQYFVRDLFVRRS